MIPGAVAVNQRDPMTRPVRCRHDRMRDRWAMMVVTAVIAAGCSGGEDGSTATSTSGAAESATTTTPDTDSSSPSTSVGSATPSTSAPPSSSPPTTAPPQLEPYPAGVVFSGPVEVLSMRAGLRYDNVHIAEVGDELWVLGRQWNSSVAARSLDGGATWTEVSFGPPPETGELFVEHVERSTDGRYVAIATRETDCSDAVAIDGGFTSHYLCTRSHPVVFVSDDGATWAQSAITGLAPPDGSSLVIADLITVGDRFAAAGTIEGSAWRAVLFSSPDGVTWTTERSIVSDGNAMSSQGLAFDGTTLVFIAEEHPCTTPSVINGTWYLGAGVARHGRIFVGADIGSLTLQQASDHPLAPAPFEPPDPADPCGPVDGIPFHFAGVSPGFDVDLIDGTVTVFERALLREQRDQLEAARDADDEELYHELVLSAGTRRWAQMIDGEWVVTDIAGVNAPTASWSSPTGIKGQATALAGRPASITTFTSTYGVHDIYSVTDGEPAQVRSAVPLAVTRPVQTIGVDDGYLMFGFQARDPFLAYQTGDPASFVVWRTTAGEGSPLDDCNLEPGGYCIFTDLREHPDYPDFSGRDLAGVDLSGTDLGEAVFDGADLSGATLRLIVSDRNPDASFVGADLTGAQAQRAEMGDISAAVVDGASFVGADILLAEGVDFSGAVMSDAQIWDVTGVTFGNTDLTDASLFVRGGFPDLTALDYETIDITVSPDYEGSLEFDLSGLDLTGVSFSGWLSDEPVVITSLEGTVLSNTSFGNADLTRLDPATFDLGAITPAFGLICPDGGEPAGLPRSCVREG